MTVVINHEGGRTEDRAIQPVQGGEQVAVGRGFMGAGLFLVALTHVFDDSDDFHGAPFAG